MIRPKGGRALRRSPGAGFGAGGVAALAALLGGLWALPPDASSAASSAASPAARGNTAAAPASTLLDFTAEEVERIASHGPWPLPPVRDAGNPLSGRPTAVALGQRLFSERRLSPAGVACADCHDPARAFTDGRARSVGVSEVERNAPSLLNAVHERWQGWGGESDSLWSQALRTLLDPREMASSPGHVARTVRADPALAQAWGAATGKNPAAVDDETLLVGVAQALGAWNATLVSARTPFDDFRDALVRGDRTAAAAYPLAAQRGLRLFVGRGNCQVCHHGPRFSHGEFADIGARFFVRPGVVDPGRHTGIAALRAGRYHLLSRWSDATPEEAAKTRHVEVSHRHFGEFKVPSLRHVAQTAPYLHDGQLPTLQAVVRHYSVLDASRLHADGEQILRPLHLTPQEEDDLVAFLATLSPR